LLALPPPSRIQAMDVRGMLHAIDSTWRDAPLA